MKIELTFLHSKVARRIFFLFVWCALLPISILAAVSFFQVSAKFRSQNQTELRQASKARGMMIVERLETLDAELRTISLGLQGSGATPHDELEAHFLNITVFYPQGKAIPLLGSIVEEPSFNATAKAHLVSGKSLLLRETCSATAKNCLLIIHAVDPLHADLGLIAGQISADYLWDKESLPSSLDLSVFDASTPLFGTKESIPSVRSLAEDQIGQGEHWFEWKQGNTLYDAAYWRLPLGPQFHAAPWTIVISRNHNEVIAPLLEFRHTFLLVVLLALWTVTLASLIQIRRTLGPVEKLREATRDLVAQKFDSRVQIESGDEFQDLATSFNSMAGQLGKQFQALEELHWGTLTALARAIDAKSSWTAGHSERVTRMALKIGEAMGLNAHDLKIMHRGGLLHDIGKIGTPQEILDKPGKLTAQEMKTMREHVEVGLRILEPIPGLSESLPIVAQHHEAFDGSGYPKGLAGTAINFYARIFAVADSYDAMTSDRPYRKGLPVEKAFSMIRERAGTQFDPDVVEAFLAMRSSSQKDQTPETSLSPFLPSLSAR